MKRLIILFTLVSCGPLEDSATDDHRTYPGGPHAQSVDPEMQEFYTRFEILVGAKASHIPSSFSYLEYPTVGLCWSYGYHDNEIEIDRDYWQRASDSGREQLMFHELGHCALNLEHNDKRIKMKDYSIPESIMYPTTFGESSYYEMFRNYYIKELKP